MFLISNIRVLTEMKLVPHPSVLHSAAGDEPVTREGVLRRFALVHEMRMGTSILIISDIHVQTSKSSFTLFQAGNVPYVVLERRMVGLA